MYWRRFAVKEIPISDAAAFELWLRDRWTEKDELLEYYAENGRFPEDDSNSQKADATEDRLRQRVKVGGKDRIVTVVGGTNSNGEWEGPVETEVKITRFRDILGIFTVAVWVSPVYYFRGLLAMYVGWLLHVGKLMGILQ